MEGPCNDSLNALLINVLRSEVLLNDSGAPAQSIDNNASSSCNVVNSSVKSEFHFRIIFFSELPIKFFG